MTQSPLRPYSLETAHGKLRIRGGDGEGEQNPAGTGEGGAGNEGEPHETEEQKAVREAQEAADAATEKAKAAEKRAADAEKKLTDKEREGMEDHEKLQADHEDLQTRYDKLLKFVETSFLDSAIMKMSAARNKDGAVKYEWQDVEAVRAFLDMDAVKLDMDTGAIDGLDKQLADIAKKRPYLLVQPGQGDPNGGNNNGGGNFQPPPGPGTGNHPYGGTNRQRETDSNKLAKKFKFDHLVVGGSPR